MKRIWILASVILALAWTVDTAFAQSQTAPGQTPPTPEAQATPQAQPVPQSTSPVSPEPAVKVEAGVGVTAIVEKAKKAPAKEAVDTDMKLRETAKLVEKEAATKGEQTVASRLASEFGLSAEALVAEKGTYQTGWGDLMIAHTLLANANSEVTLDQLFEMRRDGLGWGQIGHGLDLKLGGIVSAVKAETRVATGAAKADGRPAKIQNASVRANAGTKVGVGASQKGAGVSADVGVGAAVKGHSGK